MIAGIFWLLVGNAAVLLGARAILRRVETGNGAVDMLLFLIVRLLLISAAILAAGLTGTLHRLPLGLACAAAFATLLALGVHRVPFRMRPPEAGTAIWCFAALIGLRFLVQVWFFSPHLGDAVAYHLPKVASWVQAGTFTREMGLHPHVTFPAGFELIETWWVVFLRHDVLIELAGAEFLLLAFTAVYALARHAGAGSRAGVLAAVIFVLTPGFHLSASSCLNDAPAAAAVVAVATLVATRAPMALAIAAAGMGIGIKPTAGFALPGIVLLAWLIRRDPRPLGRNDQLVSVSLAGLGLALGAFWYGRNLAWFGSPVYPLGATEIDNPVAVQLGPSLQSLGYNVADLVNRRAWDNRGALGANVDQIAGWGPAALACGLPGLVACWENVRLRRLTAAFALSLATSLLFVQNDPWCMKYVFFFPAILAIAAAHMAESSSAIRVACALALGFSFLATLLPYDLPAGDFVRLAAQPWRTRSAISLAEPDLPEDAVGCFGGYPARSYSLYRPDFSRRVVYLRPASTQELLAGIRSADVRVLYAAPVTSAENAILEEAVRYRALIPRGGHLFDLAQ